MCLYCSPHHTGHGLITSTPTQDAVSQLVTKHYKNLHSILNLDPPGLAGSLYSCQFFGDSTLNYVTTVMGVPNQTKAHRLLQDCKQSILNHKHPEKRLRELLDILRSAQPAANPLADMILQEVSTFCIYSLCNFRRQTNIHVN